MSDEVQNQQNVGAFDDGKEVSSLGPPAPSDDLAKCIRCRWAMPWGIAMADLRWAVGS